MVRLGHQVAILALHHNFRALECRHYAQDGVDVQYVGQMHVLKRGNTKSYLGPTRLIQIALLATYQLMVHALRMPTDVYHLGKPHPMNGLAILGAHLIKKRPVYLDCDDYEAASNRFSARWQKWVVAFFEDRLPAVAAGITVNTHFTRKRLEELGYPADRIVYVPNGVDRERFSGIGNPAVEALRQQLNLVSRRVVLYVGSLSLASHAVDLLLEAFALVQRVESHALLMLVGGGEDYEELQIQAKALRLADSIRFVGRVPPHRVPLYYRMADVSVDPVRDTPAEQARSPLKLFESLASGTPVITGDVGDRRSILASGGGLLLPPNDIEALAQSLVRILANGVLHTRLSAEAMEIRRHYYWDVLVSKFAQVYEAD